MQDNAASTRHRSTRITTTITRNPRRAILFALILLSLCVLGLVVDARRPPVPHELAAGPDAIGVLFIGNSYTMSITSPDC